MNVKAVPEGKLRLSEYNPRIITKHDFKALVGSIKEFGMVEPIVANKNSQVIGGHQRLRACRELGMKEIPVFFVDLTKVKERALNLALNRIHGDWDELKLAEIMDGLNRVEDINLTVTGFSNKEIDSLLEEAMLSVPRETEDLIPDLPKTPKSKEGQVYELGRHRLMCGDATKKEDVEKLMAGKQADICFMDPPYNVDYQSRGWGKSLGKIKGDNQKPKDFEKFVDQFLHRMSENLKSGGVFYICSGYTSYPVFYQKIHEVGLQFSTCIVWVKNTISMGWGDYQRKYEQVVKGSNRKNKKGQPIVYGWKKGATHSFIDERDEADVWQIHRRASNTMVHPNQKPLALVKKALRNSSKRGEAMIDLFAGAGGTLIAAEEIGRTAYVMDLDPHYCDVIRGRYENWVEREKVVREVKSRAEVSEKLEKDARTKTSPKRPQKQEAVNA
jgi:DNA modification methylase